MKLIDRISLGRLLSMILNFICKIVELLSTNKKVNNKPRARWRKRDE